MEIVRVKGDKNVALLTSYKYETTIYFIQIVIIKLNTSNVSDSKKWEHYVKECEKTKLDPEYSVILCGFSF